MSYIDIVEHYEDCFRKYGDNNKGVDWPKEADAQTRYKVMLDIARFDPYRKKEKYSLLDFGCGLGHLDQYILDHRMNIDYAGLDASETFVNQCRQKFPGVPFFHCDLMNEEAETSLPQYDYIVMNGVFTEKLAWGYDEMLDYFQKLVTKVYEKCNYGIAFNVMSKDVDWERDDLFHLPLNVLSRFLTQNITRDFIIRNDYGLYEYTAYVYKRGKEEAE